MNNENKENNINTTTEEKVSPRDKKDLIKTILIVFLAILLVLTFFSNTIMNKSLAEITTETATSYTSPQWCDSKGTEEYVGSELPVGHNTDYPMTMIDCADGLGNGTYTPKLTVTNGKLSFEWQSV